MMLTGFFLAPFLVHHLGLTGYGVWTLVISLTGYFGMLDLGMRQSVGRFVSRYVALSDHQNVNATLSTAVAMLAGAGAIVLLLMITLRSSLHLFHIEQQFEGPAKIAILIASLNISLALPLSVFSTVLLALERFDVIAGVSIIGALSRAAAAVVVLTHGGGIVALALVTLSVSSAEYMATATAAKLLYPALRVRASLVTRKRCGELFGFGIYRFLWVISNQLIFYTDSVVIGAFLNAGAITYYAIAGNLVNYGRSIVSLASDTLFPAATKLDAQGDKRGLQELHVFGTTVALMVGLPLCAGFFFLGRQFITLWMGAGYNQSALLLIVLTIPQIFSMAQYVSALILVSMARHRILALIALFEGIANLALSIVLVRKYGLIGVAWGTVIPHVISMAVVVPIYTLRSTGMRARDYFFKAWLRPLIAILPVAGCCYALSVAVTTPSWPLFAAEVVAVCLLHAVMLFLVCLDSTQRTSILRKLGMLDREAAMGEV